MKLYRLERHGLGPFSQFTDYSVPQFSVTCEDVKFKKGDNPKKFLFGCDSEQALEEYFGEEIVEHLERVGYKIKEYIVNDKKVRKSPNNKQVAFHAEELIEKLTVDNPHYVKN